MSHVMSWAAAGVWFCALMAVGCAGIAFVMRPRRNRRLRDAGRSRIDPRDFLQKFYNENGRTHHGR